MAVTTTRTTRPVTVPIDHAGLAGDLATPERATGLVVFAHGSGSSRFSSRNRHVADVLDRRGLATLLIDLLTEREETVDQLTAQLRFDVAMLADRLVRIGTWAREQPAVRDLPIGLFGASTGGGAALIAAAREPSRFAAVVSRGGRPDLAGDALPHVTAPTLLIVGGRDTEVIALNEIAKARMTAPVRLEIVPGATHLFEEPGTLERVAALAADFFAEHLR